MSHRQYLLDENVNPRLRKALKQHYPDMTVWQVGDVGTVPRGTLDPEILLWCERHQFSLVTNNRTSMPVHLRDHLLAGHHVPAIFIIHDGMSIGEIVSELGLIWELADPDEFADLINFLPID